VAAETEPAMCAKDACFASAEVPCEPCGASYCRGHAKHPEHDRPRDDDQGAPEIPSSDYGPE
jgi:hypothetical protein